MSKFFEMFEGYVLNLDLVEAVYIHEDELDTICIQMTSGIVKEIIVPSKDLETVFKEIINRFLKYQESL